MSSSFIMNKLVSLNFRLSSVYQRIEYTSFHVNFYNIRLGIGLVLGQR